MKKRLIAVLLTVTLLMALLSSGMSAAALVLCETQYAYDTADMSWLKDLIVKEDMTTVSGLSKRSDYTAKADYPYNATAASFREEVGYYEILYTLDEDMANVAYLYALQVAEQFAQAAGDGKSDEFIRSYLESMGIVYPSGSSADSSETKIIARALYAVISADSSYAVTRGTGLYEAFLSYFSTILGVDISAVMKFSPDADLSDLKKYIVAACKLALYQSGYAVTADTPDSEVYRLMAIMTIRAQGISIDSGTATFEEVKNKYLCAMLCKVYEVSIDYSGFEAAMNGGNLPYYMLQLIGKENGIAVRSSLTYEEAFDLVCKNTTYFNLEPGEFYADIYEYDIPLEYKRDAIWIYPQPLATTSESGGTTVAVTINGETVRESYYNKISLDSSKATEAVTITVEYSDTSGVKKSTSYRLNITQGTTSAPVNNTISNALTGVAGSVEDVLQSMGFESSLTEIVSNIPFSLPDRILSIASLIMPSFTGGTSFGSRLIQAIFGYSSDDDSRVESGDIGGVGGLDAYMSAGNSSLSLDFNSLNGNTPGQLDLGGLQAETTTNSANSVVIGGAPVVVAPGVTDDSSDGWFSDFIHNGAAVAVVVVALGAAFGVCLVLFLKLFNERQSGGMDSRDSAGRGSRSKKRSGKR